MLLNMSPINRSVMLSSPISSSPMSTFKNIISLSSPFAMGGSKGI